MNREIDQGRLTKYLDVKLFEDLFKFTLKNLNQVYLEFKKTEKFFLLKEEIIRKEKLYEIMIEAGIIA
jgi:hypothetical protein